MKQMFEEAAERANAIEPGTMCDFCSRETRELTCFPAKDFVRNVIVRGKTMIVQSCECHAPVEHRPDDEIMSEVMSGGWGACPACTAAIQANDPLTLAMIAHDEAELAFGDPVMPVEFFVGLHEPYWFHADPGGRCTGPGGEEMLTGEERHARDVGQPQELGL